VLNKDGSTYLGNVFIDLTSLFSFRCVAVGDSNLVDKTESSVASEPKAPIPATATVQSAAAADSSQSVADADNAQSATAADTAQPAAAADTAQPAADADTSQSAAAADTSQSVAAADTAQPTSVTDKKQKATDDGSSTGDRSTGEEEEETPKPRPGGKRHGRAECGVCGQIVTQVGEELFLTFLFFILFRTGSSWDWIRFDLH
jgi:hypothetical protein